MWPLILSLKVAAVLLIVTHTLFQVPIDQMGKKVNISGKNCDIPNIFPRNHCCWSVARASLLCWVQPCNTGLLHWNLSVLSEDLINNMEIMTTECKSLPGNSYRMVWPQNCSKSYYIHKIWGFELAIHQSEWRSGGWGTWHRESARNISPGRSSESQHGRL